MPLIGVYDWSMVTTPAALAPYLATANSANAPGTDTYNAGQPSWINQTYTYNGGAPTHVKIVDDDGVLQDGVVETGAAQVLAEDVVLNGTLYTAGSVVENEFALLDGGGSEVWVIRIAGQNVGFAPQAPYYTIPGGVTFTPTQARDGLGGAGSTDGISSSANYSQVVCFSAGTRLETSEGPLEAGRVTLRTRLRTADGRLVTPLWIGRQEVALAGPEDRRRPLKVPRHALGYGMPGRAVVLSPQHRVRVGAVLMPARALESWHGVRVMRGWAGVIYVHVLCARHEILMAEGLPVESLLPGPQVFRAMPLHLRAQVRSVLADQAPMQPALPCLTVAEGRKMLADGETSSITQNRPVNPLLTNINASHLR